MNESNNIGAGYTTEDPRFATRIHQIPAQEGYTFFVDNFAVQLPFEVGPQGGYKPLRMYAEKNPQLLTSDDLKEGMFVYGDVKDHPDIKIVEIKPGVSVKLGTPHPAYQEFCDLVAKGALPVNDIFQLVSCEGTFKASRMAELYPGKKFAMLMYRYTEAADPTCVNTIHEKVLVAMMRNGLGGVTDDGTPVAINPCCLEPNAWPLFWNGTSGKQQLQGKMIDRKYAGTSYASRHKVLKVVQTDGIGNFPAFLVGDVEVLPDIEALFNFAANLRKL